ncbi:uncharacterized protein CCOS01_08026 [Colletotrichum costaricense]|uniref:Xylanolytic transcriptional activator regulatory domain-containing protein n=1 Tax=Colletotrichum costaricense TaxID=1209916 RepID=A0AAJ0DZ98_9PEZI|nr:uncharacterized protein CCOS01_08026 [Colletotrichum costaricense]KAK1525608.1 hypothetical protein CCOS01_08026 [Colletotrichum costaricense]
MCALGTQFVWPSADQKLESELGESVDHLGMRMHEAAQRLSTFIPPGEGGLPLIQRLFLAGGWLKNRVEVTRSWHLICSAVREAQEIGLHIDSAAQEISTCEREVRRRMWYILNIWDTTFSGSFGRPRIIQEFGQVPPPNPRFELADSVSEETSAAAIIIREYRLWAFLSDPLSDANSPHAKIQFVNDWIRGLPTVYSTIRSGAIGDGDLFANKFRRIKLHYLSADEQRMMNQSSRTGDIGGFDATFPAGEETTEANLLESFSPLESIEQLLVGDNFEMEATAQDAADLDLGLVGIGYNGSGIMALEEQINSDIFNTTWSWDNID